MRSIRLALPLLLLVCLGLAARCEAQSVFPLRPDDPLAAYVTPQAFGAHADGVGDDSAALQAAIDRVQQTTHHGVVFIPSGRYRLSATVHVWAGIRLIGYGPTRPVLLLAPNTPGFQHVPQPPDSGLPGGAPPALGRYMLWFTDERMPPSRPLADASEFTFFSGLINVDFEIGAGNPAAVAIRFNVAQHSMVAHANFHLQSGFAALEQIGNQASDIHVVGGEFGIITGKTAPAWQFLLMDSSFQGQRQAAIRTREAGFTLVRDRFAALPVAIEIPSGQVEQLYGRDLELDDIHEAVLRVGDVRNLESEITLEHVACRGVHRFVVGAEQALGPKAAMPTPSRPFLEERFRLGLEIGADGREQGIRLQHREAALTSARAALHSDVPALPPMTEWVNVHTLGVKGDGGSDDTAALQRAIATHRVLYLPSGIYRLTGSLRLRPDTVLIGFNPFSTELVLNDADAHFQGGGAAMPLIVAPRGGANIVSGIGIATGNANPRAAGIEWQAGPHSLVEDVDFIRGHSEYVRALAPAAPPPLPYRQRPPMQLDQQHPSLWIHNGGGGVVRGVWSHAGTAQAGLVIENTDTHGVIYQFSCEHHMRDEVRIDHAANWRIYDLQTEEENPEGAQAVAIELNAARHIVFANTYMYRVSRNVLPMPYAAIAHASTDISFDNVKVFSQTRLPFDNTVYDAGSGVAVRAHHFVHFALTGDLHRGAPLPLPAAFAAGARLRRVATGYSNASGLTADGAGNIYFSDAARHTIYRYTPGSAAPQQLASEPSASPMVLAFVAPNTLLAINNEKSVFALEVETDAGKDAQTGVQTGTPLTLDSRSTPKPGTVLLLPVGLHNELMQLDWLLGHEGYVYRRGSNSAVRSPLQPEPRTYFYVPGTNTAVIAGGTWRPLLQSSQLAPFAVGTKRLVTSEDDGRTWLATLDAGEKLATQLFAERGGTSVVRDRAGNVYLAGDQIYVYDNKGRQTGVLEIPERPSSLCFGGTDRRTLFIAARGSLYAIRVKSPGE